MGIEKFSMSNSLFGVLFNRIFVIDLVGAYKESDISKNKFVSIMPFAVILVIYSGVCASFLWHEVTTSFWYRARKLYGMSLSDIVFSTMSLFLLVLIVNRLFNYFESKKA